MSDILTPESNLCIAQKLRAMAPGASGAEAVLMSGPEQLQLLAVTTERAQRAMLGFAVLGLAAMPDSNEDEIGVYWDWYPDARIGRLRKTLRHNENAPLVKTLGQDFAAAVSLHAVLSSELASLLGRSASARAPRGGSASMAAEELWGPASWRQRTMASVFGGIAMASELDKSSPWSEPTGKTSPAAQNAVGFYDSWPNFMERPYPTKAILDPRVHTFRTLAAAVPNLRVYKAWLGSSGCAIVDIPATAGFAALYVEQNLRGGPIPSGTPWESYELWTKYGITFEHVKGFAQYLADMMNPICIIGHEGPTGASAMLGGVDIKTDQQNVTYFQISGAATFAPRGAEETAGAYMRYAPWRMPKAVFLNATSSSQGFPDLENEANNANYDTMGHIGTASSLVAVREALRSMNDNKAFTSTLPSNLYRPPSDVYDDYTKYAKQILNVVNAVAGKSSVTIRPRVWPDDDGVLQSDCTTYKGVYSCTYDVDVVAPSGDAWFSSATNLEVRAIKDNPWMAAALRDPTHKYWGKTAPEGLAALTGWSALTKLTATSPESASGLARFSGTIGFTEDTAHDTSVRLTLIARGDVAGKVSYRLLADDVQLVQSYRPQIGYYLPVDGDLPSFAAKINAYSKQNPTEPAYDGFGFPTDWVPPTDASLFGGSQGQSAVQYYIAAAKTSADEATVAVKGAFDSLLQQEQDEAAKAAAEKRNSEVNNLEQRALCGDNHPTCQDEVSPTNVPILEWSDWAKMVKVLCQENTDPDKTDMGVWSEYFTAAADQWKLYVDGHPSIPPNDPDQYLEAGASFIYTALGGPGLQLARTFVDSAYRATIFGQMKPYAKISNEDWAGAQVIYCQSAKILGLYAGASKDAADKPTVAVPKAVADVRSAKIQPAFSSFAGGSLQQGLIRQWAALRSMDDLANEFVLQTDAAVGKFLAAAAIANAADTLYKTQCNGAKWGEAYAACFTVSVGFPSGISISYNPSPLISYEANCNALLINAGPPILAAHAEKAQAIAGVGAMAARFTDATRDVFLASAAIQEDVHKTELSAARNDLEAELTKSTLPTTLGLYRNYHSYDLWRAKALLESARRHGVTARRAIEARFGVNLSQMHAQEPFVAAPASWADEIYAYDLSLPAAVGVTVGEAQPGGIYANKVSDYVSNLQSFVDGFSVARPSTSNKEDTEIVSLVGPYMTRTAQDPDQPGKSGKIPDSSAARWQVFCPGTDPSKAKWVSTVSYKLCFDDQGQGGSGGAPSDCTDVNGYDWEGNYQGGHTGAHYVPFTKPFAELCPPESLSTQYGPPPTRARISFVLDPWGRLEGDMVQPAYQVRYNTRWNRVALNFVGTGVKDCAKASNASACYSQPFVRYNLTHTGPAWSTSYDGQWFTLPVPTATIEGGKAVAAEMLLDPLFNSWSKPHIDAAGRLEYAERPVGGTYVLEFDVPPEVIMERLEQVQVLMSQSYWVQELP
ncbi:MAG: hypothetical protein HY898_03060 [Deltaproteobacteria bacterium]|nr:hypothetical protein [Deltaproteobacteria bacterium]